MNNTQENEKLNALCSASINYRNYRSGIYLVLIYQRKTDTPITMTPVLHMSIVYVRASLLKLKHYTQIEEYLIESDN